MFGYITINKPELKIKDFDLYQSYYCGLCRGLKNTYGLIEEICVNYDMTFLALVLSGLYEPEEKAEDRKCLLHPFAKHDMITNECTEYAADMSLILMYYKCEDDWHDEKNKKRGALKMLLQASMKKVRKKYPQKCKFIKTRLKKLRKLEEAQETNLDLMSGLFGEIMGQIFEYKQDEWSEDLSKMGYYLGKFIYIMDAYDDLEEDLSKGQYNPLVRLKDREDFHDYMEQILKMMMAQCARHFERMPILLHGDLLRNIIYGGVWNAFEMKRKKTNEEDTGEN